MSIINKLLIQFLNNIFNSLFFQNKCIKYFIKKYY